MRLTERNPSLFPGSDCADYSDQAKFVDFALMVSSTAAKIVRSTEFRRFRRLYFNETRAKLVPVYR
jgi:hypothetical protein